MKNLYTCLAKMLSSLSFIIILTSCSDVTYKEINIDNVDTHDSSDDTLDQGGEIYLGADTVLAATDIPRGGFHRSVFYEIEPASSPDTTCFVYTRDNGGLYDDPPVMSCVRKTSETIMGYGKLEFNNRTLLSVHSGRSQGYRATFNTITPASRRDVRCFLTDGSMHCQLALQH